ncbi:MAG: hypothetical protein HOQ05_05255 [Corynebacteriales bacterium]|nr:hypothetical protein [Mycobacteriales bacterium]
MVQVPHASRATAVINAFKKAWRSGRYQHFDTAALSLPIYLLAVEGKENDALLGYDFDEFAAFFGGVFDGEFDPDVGALPAEAVMPRSPIEWGEIPLPDGIDERQLVRAFEEVSQELVWVRFGPAGPAWAQAHITVQANVCIVKVAPALTVREIRRVARLPWPPPVGAEHAGV